MDAAMRGRKKAWKSIRFSTPFSISVGRDFISVAGLCRLGSGFPPEALLDRRLLSARISFSRRR